MLRDPYIS